MTSSAAGWMSSKRLLSRQKDVVYFIEAQLSMQLLYLHYVLRCTTVRVQVSSDSSVLCHCGTTVYSQAALYHILNGVTSYISEGRA